MADFLLDMDFSDLVSFEKTLLQIGGMQQKYVTQAVRAGQKHVLNRAIAAAPVGKTGNLKANIVSAGERSRRKGKKVYDVKFRGGSEANAVLSKPIKNPGAAGGNNKKAYYPASVEYGFLTRANDGGGFKFVRGKKRVEGQHFMRDAAKDAEPQFRKAVIEKLSARLDKEWKKKCT